MMTWDMNQPDLEQLFKENKVEILPDEHLATPTAPIAPEQINITDFLPLLVALRLPKKHLTSAPTFIPKNFLEQIQFYDDATNRRLYLYINKTWRYVALT